MNKQEFMDRLAQGIVSLPLAERQEILSDYSEHFIQGALNGQNEGAIAAHLGDPEDIARDFIATAQAAQQDAHAQSPTTAPHMDGSGVASSGVASSGVATPNTANKQWDSGLQVLVGVGLVCLTLFVTLPFAGALLGVLCALFGVGIVLIVTGCLLGYMAIFGVAVLLAMIFLVCFGLLWLIGSGIALKWFIKGCVWYVRACISLTRYGVFPTRRVKEAVS